MKELERIHQVKNKKFLFKVETSEDPKDYAKYEELRLEIWGEPRDTLPGTRNMWCENFIHEGSSLFIGVYAEDKEGRFKLDKEHLVGFSYGFVGVKDKDIAFRAPDNLQFYSQYTAVRPDFQSFGLGVLIKEFQKEKLTSLFGIYAATCTYDPLTGVNAYRNIHRLGMDVVDYRVAHYGEFGGLLNRADIPCDRFFLSWDLRKEVERPVYDLGALVDAECSVIHVEAEEIKGRSGKVRLEVVKKVDLKLNREFLLVEIPFDFYLMLRETDVGLDRIRRIPLEWRMATRQAFLSLFNRGYKVVDFRHFSQEDRQRDFYVLRR